MAIAKLFAFHTNATRNATRCNNHDELLHLSFAWKISIEKIPIFLEAYI